MNQEYISWTLAISLWSLVTAYNRLRDSKLILVTVVVFDQV